MSSTRELLFSVTLDDCEVQHFRSGGKGGQHQNKTDSGTRIIHHPSGARGESREERSQLQNKKVAFKRMASHPLFQWWVHVEVLKRTGGETPEERVDSMIADPSQWRVEVKNAEGRWVTVEEGSPLAPDTLTVTGSGIHVRSGRKTR